MHVSHLLIVLCTGTLKCYCNLALKKKLARFWILPLRQPWALLVFPTHLEHQITNIQLIFSPVVDIEFFSWLSGTASLAAKDFPHSSRNLLATSGMHLPEYRKQLWPSLACCFLAFSFPCVVLELLQLCSVHKVALSVVSSSSLNSSV